MKMQKKDRAAKGTKRAKGKDSPKEQQKAGRTVKEIMLAGGVPYIPNITKEGILVEPSDLALQSDLGLNPNRFSRPVRF